jgi:acylphosphatase
MNKCLRITISGEFPANFFRDVLQKHAKKLNVEGTVQALHDGTFRIIACGDKDDVDAFLDILHKGSLHIGDMEIEPFLKDRDYRGVFRVIE